MNEMNFRARVKKDCNLYAFFPIDGPRDTE